MRERRAGFSAGPLRSFERPVRQDKGALFALSEGHPTGAPLKAPKRIGAYGSAR